LQSWQRALALYRRSQRLRWPEHRLSRPRSV
jgi:hypothetical protein